jgi:hypothetical protein
LIEQLILIEQLFEEMKSWNLKKNTKKTVYGKSKSNLVLGERGGGGGQDKNLVTVIEVSE